MTLGTADADRFVRALAEENAQLRALLQTKETSLPPSPPISATDPSMPVSPADPLGDPLLKLRLPSSKTAIDDEDISPLRTIIELLRVQIASQSSAQDQLLGQLGELRSSHANLQAATSDVTDELVVMREKSARLAAEVKAEREQRQRVEEEKASEIERVQTLRSKVEESRRAIMRLQDEAASRRANDSRRGSAVLLNTPLSERRGSLGMPGTGILDPRRGSLLAGTPGVLAGRRASVAVCDTSPGVGLGLDFAGNAASPAVPESRSTPSHGGGHRRAVSVASSAPYKPTADNSHAIDERLAALRGTQRSSSAAPELPDARRRSSLAILEEGVDQSAFPAAPIRRYGSLSVTASRPPPARSSIAGSRRRSSGTGLSGTLLPRNSMGGGSTGEDEAAVLRAQLQALQRRLNEVEAAPTTRKLTEYTLDTTASPAVIASENPHGSGSRRPSASVAFGSFSFQSRGRNPALLDTPPSPSGGSFSPGGSRRREANQDGPFGGMTTKEQGESASSSDTEPLTMTPSGGLLAVMAQCEITEADVEKEQA